MQTLFVVVQTRNFLLKYLMCTCQNNQIITPVLLLSSTGIRIRQISKLTVLTKHPFNSGIQLSEGAIDKFPALPFESLLRLSQISGSVSKIFGSAG